LDGNAVAGDWFARTRATFDIGTSVPLDHSSVWLRSAGGAAAGPRQDPFANFFFGAFGNNWVDHGNEKRYREYYAFPGADLNEVSGRTFVRSTVEWNIPPVRFRNAGTPGLYVTWLRPAVFAGVLTTNPEAEEFRHVLGNAGAQLDVQITALSTLDMMLSVGGAVAFERGFAPRREFMISFKVLK
jgi:hypothetical protein